MIATSIARGFSRASARKGLILVIYAIGLAIAILLTVPFATGIGQEIGQTGFSRDLAERFNFLILFELLEEAAPLLSVSFRLVLVAIPFYLIWKIATHVGLIHALHGEATHSFWEGVGRYTLKGLGIAVLYLVPLALVLVILVAITGAITSEAGEIFQYRVRFIAAPIVVVLVTAFIDCMHDYARMHLVLREKGVFAAWIAGVVWPFKHFGAVFVYLFWFVVGGAIWFLPFLVDHWTAEKTALVAVAVLLLQQVVQLVRTGVTVAWLGSEVTYFEAKDEPAEIRAPAAGLEEGMNLAPEV
jgi:hypothetical protein